MRTDVMDLYRKTVQRLEEGTGKPARLTVDTPTNLRGDRGRFERVGAIWFLSPDGEKVTNHGFHLDEYSPRYIRMETWGQDYHASADLTGKEITMEVMTLLLQNLLPAGLRPLERVITPDPVPEEETQRLREMEDLRRLSTFHPPQ